MALLLVDLVQADLDKLAKNERLIWRVINELLASPSIDMSTEGGCMLGQLLREIFLCNDCDIAKLTCVRHNVFGYALFCLLHLLWEAPEPRL